MQDDHATPDRDADARALQNLKTLIDNLDVGVFSIEPASGVVLHINAAGARILGFPSVAEAIGKSILGLYSDPKERAETWARFVADARTRERGVVKFEAVRLRADDGRPVNVLITLSITFDAAGQPTRFDGTIEDIVERKAAEKTFKSSEQRFRFIFESSVVASALTDPRGIVLRVNPAFLQFLGCDEGDVISRPFDDVVCESDRNPGLFAKEAPAVGLQPVSGVETRFVRRDGSIAWGLVSLSWMQEPDGAATGVVSIQDLTERRRLEEDLLHMQKLESLAVLAGGIAHDFNNILTAVMGNISLAAETAGVPQAAAERLFRAEQATTRARDLTQQLITFAKGGAPMKRPAMLTDVVRESAGLFLRGSNVLCDIAMEPGLPAAEVDVGQMVQVFNNLLLNAAQAMPDGGRVEVRLASRPVGPADGLPLAPGRYVQVQVQDHGPGIPADRVGRVFDPYFSTRQKGSGLGLATVYSIIRRHEGFVTVHSIPGKGTTFTILLPATEKRPCDPARPPDRAPRRGPAGRILVMDDEESVREVAIEILRRCGFEAQGVEDGEKAVEAWRHAREDGRPYDVVILDLTVPGAPGGAEAIDRLRQFDPDVKAIVSSGYSASAVLARYRDHGFAGVVAKPYTIEELRDVVESLLPARDARAD